MKIGTIKRRHIIPVKHPIVVNLIASYPFPCKSSLWPGKIDNAVDSSGAPRKIDGIKSMNVWTTDIEIIKQAKIIGEVN